MLNAQNIRGDFVKMSTRVVPSDVRDVLDVLGNAGFSPEGWRELGQRLRVRGLDAINEVYKIDGVGRCLEEVVENWKRHGDFRWDTLIRAVEECDGVSSGGGAYVAKMVQDQVSSLPLEPLGSEVESGSTVPANVPLPVDEDEVPGRRGIPRQSSSVDSAIGSEGRPSITIPFSSSTKQPPYMSWSIDRGESISEEPAVSANDIYNEIFEAKNQSLFLGVKLRLPEDVRKRIIAEKLDNEKRLLRTLEEYLKRKTYKPDWKEITLALKEIELTSLAEKVKNNHAIEPQKISVTVVSVEREYRNLKRQFRDFVSFTRDRVRDKKISIQLVLDTIVHVGGSRNKHYFLGHADELRKSQSIEAVFDRIIQHWDCLHPEIYSHLIEELSLGDVQQIRDDYHTALDNFLDHTLVSDFCEVKKIFQEESEGDPPEKFTKCVTKHNWEPPPKFLRDVDNLRRQFAQYCNLQSCAVTVCDIRRGCTRITFSVPESIDLTIAEDPIFIRDHSIIRITFKENLMYSQEISESGSSVDAFLKMESAFPVVALRFVRQELSRIASVVLRQPQTPLTVAAENGNLEKVLELLSKGADPNPQTDSTPLKEASCSGDIKMATALLQAGANPDLVTDDWTALMEACRVGNSEMIELLLEYGHADPNTVNSENWTALMTASGRGHYEAVDILLQRGANPDMQDCTGWSALMTAVYRKRVKITLRLIEGGAKPDIEDKNHTNALLLALAKPGQEEMVDALLDRNPDVNLQDSYGETALIFACKIRSLHFVKRLLRMGASPNIYNNDRETPVLIAIGLSEEEILLELLENGADPNMGIEPPLLVAAHIGNHNIVKILAKFGADTYLRDRHGVAAFEVAELRNFKELINELDPSQMSSSTPKNVVKLAKKSLTSVVNQLKRGPQFLITETQRETKYGFHWMLEKLKII